MLKWLIHWVLELGILGMLQGEVHCPISISIFHNWRKKICLGQNVLNLVTVWMWCLKFILAPKLFQMCFLSITVDWHTFGHFTAAYLVVCGLYAHKTLLNFEPTVNSRKDEMKTTQSRTFEPTGVKGQISPKNNY